MPRGLRMPVGVDGTGGAALVESEDNDTKIIYLALGSGHNENAFQQEIALGDDMIFDLADPALKARILRRVNRIFDDFVRLKRYKLVRDSVRFKEDPANQELSLEFKYINLESDEERTFSRKFTRAS